jgi:LysM repeat protein
VHVVKPGETLLMIASMYGTTPEAIAQANGLTNPNWIYVGQTLRIP